MANKNPAFMVDSFTGDYSFLSNFEQCDVEYNGVTYPSVEHAFQAAKSPEAATAISQSGVSAGRAKRLGKWFPLRNDWESVKLGIMYNLLSQKFNKEPFKIKLIDTGSSSLVEGNNWGDTYWGVCNGVGKNCLGKLLMAVRADINIAGMVEA